MTAGDLHSTSTAQKVPTGRSESGVRHRVTGRRVTSHWVTGRRDRPGGKSRCSLRQKRVRTPESERSIASAGPGNGLHWPIHTGLSQNQDNQDQEPGPDVSCFDLVSPSLLVTVFDGRNSQKKSLTFLTVVALVRPALITRYKHTITETDVVFNRSFFFIKKQHFVFSLFARFKCFTVKLSLIVLT